MSFSIWLWSNIVRKFQARARLPIDTATQFGKMPDRNNLLLIIIFWNQNTKKLEINELQLNQYKNIAKNIQCFFIMYFEAQK